MISVACNQDLNYAHRQRKMVYLHIRLKFLRREIYISSMKGGSGEKTVPLPMHIKINLGKKIRPDPVEL